VKNGSQVARRGGGGGGGENKWREERSEVTLMGAAKQKIENDKKRHTLNLKIT